MGQAEMSSSSDVSPEAACPAQCSGKGHLPLSSIVVTSAAAFRLALGLPMSSKPGWHPCVSTLLPASSLPSLDMPCGPCGHPPVPHYSSPPCLSRHEEGDHRRCVERPWLAQHLSGVGRVCGVSEATLQR